MVHCTSMDDMVSVGLRDFLFGGLTARQPSTLQPINTRSTLVGSICCLTAGESVHAGSCPAPGQRNTHGDVRTNRHTPKHTLVRCNSSKALRAEHPPRGASEGQQMYLQAKPPRWHVFKHPRTFAALAVNTLHHLFRKDKIRKRPQWLFRGQATTARCGNCNNKSHRLKLFMIPLLLFVFISACMQVACFEAGYIIRKISAGCFTESDCIFVSLEKIQLHNR